MWHVGQRWLLSLVPLGSSAYFCIFDFATLSLYSMARPPTAIPGKQQMAKLYQVSSSNLFTLISSYVDVGQQLLVNAQKYLKRKHLVGTCSRSGK